MLTISHDVPNPHAVAGDARGVPGEVEEPGDRVEGAQPGGGGRVLQAAEQQASSMAKKSGFTSSEFWCSLCSHDRRQRDSIGPRVSGGRMILGWAGARTWMQLKSLASSFFPFQIIIRLTQI